MRVAVADIGTNSTRLLVADVTADGAVDEVERLLQITRLGEGVDGSGRLAPAPRERVLSCLEGYAGRADAHAATRRLAVATSAVRDAANRDEFLASVAATGFEPRLLSGDEEAAATFRGVTSSRTGASAGLVVIDVGGGSTELVVGDAAGGVAWSRSYPAGCVRMTERFLGEEVVSPRDVERCREAVLRLLDDVPDSLLGTIRAAVGVAGTATTVAGLDLGLEPYDPELIHGRLVRRATVEHWLERLGELPLVERCRVRGLDPARAPVICGGLVTLGAVMDRLALDRIEISERDILHGAALLAAGH